MAQREFLRRLARGVIGDDALAEDVVQEAELRALARGPEATESRRGWLVTVTRRLALNVRRARARRDLHERAAARTETDPCADPALEGLELQRAVLDGVRGLDEPSRTVVWQRYYEDRSPSEIANRMGVPLATVKTRLRRALQRLRTDLDAAHGGQRELWTSGLLVWLGPPAPVIPPSPSSTIGGAIAVSAAVAVLGWFGWQAMDRPGAPATEERGATRGADATLPRATDASVREASASNGGQRHRLEAESSANAPDGGAECALDVHVMFADGTDAAEIGLVLWPVDDGWAELHARCVETRADGRALFAGLAPGAYELHSDRDGTTSVALLAGDEHKLEWMLPRGLQIAGRVEDESQKPIAGAEVWLEGEGSGTLGGRVVARTGPDGAFRVRDVGKYQRMGVFAEGYAPSFLERLHLFTPAPGTPEVSLTFVLDRPGQELHGQVLDPAGAPLAGAHVAFGTKGNVVNSRSDGREAWWPMARILVTDDEGRFRADWLEEGTQPLVPPPLHVLAEGYAMAFVSGDEVQSALGGELLVRLRRGAMLAGRVTDESGQPLANVRVVVRDLLANTSPFALPSVRTGADGGYSFLHVSSGEVRVAARSAADPRHGVEEMRVVAEGAEERCDLVLRGATPAMRASTPAAETRERATGTGEHTGVVRGGFTDRAGRVRPGEAIVARLRTHEGWQIERQAQLDSAGAFEFEGVARGRYRVAIDADERSLIDSPPFDVAEGELVELDWLESHRAASLAVECNLPGGTNLESVKAWLLHPQEDGVTPLNASDGFLYASELQPGRHRLRLSGAGLATLQTEVELSAGEDTRLRVDLRSGAERLLTFVAPPGVAVSHLRVLFGCPGTSWTLIEDLVPLPGHPLMLRTGFAPGSYAFDATTREGPAAHGTFEVEAAGAGAVELTIELR